MGPIPVPLPIGVVVKKGLKMRDRTVSGIAQPSLARSQPHQLQSLIRKHQQSLQPVCEKFS
ncbi:MAG: hypothetical protein RM049_02245 [Nostoc sp. DedQUE04]|uniref:hypothetical protein n=1 Tax=Nostoc sp. DedQUE04 TaxID=3075390 RepID=UPI002AD36382|nr:hypothetical protein [Nostoc sp. DedQUE04]MDZ8134107.1 hypothetical protein [Nostoc sp. DedQUE04]